MRIAVIIESRSDGQRRWEMPVQVLHAVRLIQNNLGDCAIEEAVKALPPSFASTVKMQVLPPQAGDCCGGARGSYMFIDEVTPGVAA